MDCRKVWMVRGFVKLLSFSSDQLLQMMEFGAFLWVLEKTLVGMEE